MYRSSEKRRVAWALRLAGALVGITVGFASVPHAARAAESVIPVTPPGATDVDQAFLPPNPGLYGAFVAIPFNQNTHFYDTSGNAVPPADTIHIQLQLAVPALLYVYPFKLFGGNLASSFVLPFERLNYSFGSGPSKTDVAQADAFTDLFYWTKNIGLAGATPGKIPLSYGLSVGGGLALVIPTGSYSALYPLNPGGNLWVIDPNLALTYNTGPRLSFGDNTQLSARAFFGFPQENSATHYQSGKVFDVDWSTTQQFGNLRLGAAGYFQTQLTNDQPGDGVSLPDGNKFTEAAVGPIVQYFFPDYGAFIKAKLVDTFYHKNFVNERLLVLTLGFTF